MILGQGRNQHQSELPQAPIVSPTGSRLLCRLGFAVLLMLVTVSAFAVQDSPALKAARPRHGSSPSTTAAPRQQESPLTPEMMEKYKPLLDELGRLRKKIVDNVQVPAPRTQSRLLPLLPAANSYFLSFPNYGESLHQANQIFLEELKQSPELNDWWQNKAGMIGMMVEEGIEKFYQFTQYLGNEIVISGTVNPKGGTLFVLAEARKPGLKAFIDQIIKQYVPQPKPPFRVLTQQQLLTAKATGKYKPVLILVRPDYIVATTDLATLQSFNAQLNRGGGKFGATPFGQRLAQTYPGGAQVVGGADLQKLLALRPQSNPAADNAFQQTGLADVKYFIMESKYLGGVATSNMELSFNGPRRGIASWLAAPAPLPGLDFVSTEAAYAVGFMLKSPAEMLDDITHIAESANPYAGSAVAQLETELKINLKQDLLSKLTGHFTVALDGPPGGFMLPWKFIAQTTDPDGLARTLSRLIAATSEKSGKGFTPDQKVEDGITYYSLRSGDSAKAPEVHYAFADGYLIVGGNHATVKEAIAAHRSGNSLPRSSQFQALAPQEHPSQASALGYENPTLFLVEILQQSSPDLAKMLHPATTEPYGVLGAAYAEDTAIRGVTTSRGFDPTAVALVAAVVIPNIMKSRNAAIDATAVANMRTLNTAEAMYQNDYNKYAPDLGTLGCGDGGHPSADHACVIDNQLGCADAWCGKNGYRYNLTATCKDGQCDNYVALATPVNPGQHGKNFCSTADAVVRSHAGPPLTDTITVEQCQSWPPI